MSNRIHALAQQLTGKASVEECSLEEVQHIAQRYPYFAPAQFLLVQKLGEINSPELETQERKAVLFFHDPLLFQSFISSDNFYTEEDMVISKSGLQPVIGDGDETAPDNTNEIVNEERVVTGDPLEAVDVVEEGVIEEESESQDEMFLETDLAEEQETDEEISEPVFLEDTVPPEVIQNALQNHLPDSTAIDHSAGLISTYNENDGEAVATTTETTAASPTPKEELFFEPLHAVDYFASQGIKISQDALPNDRLGKQMKSFTDWLKTMKRLPAQQTADRVEIIAERKVENMASRSVSESTIITEAMAEVWAKQGAREKAIETYNKLSLLYPSKKAFFAAKIENLKTF